MQDKSENKEENVEKEEEGEEEIEDPYMRSKPDSRKKKMFAFDWSQGYISPYRGNYVN